MKRDRGSFLETGCPLWTEGCTVFAWEERVTVGLVALHRRRGQGLNMDTDNPCFLELTIHHPIGQPRLRRIIPGRANRSAQPGAGV